jgi:hypothetical protein
MHARAVRSEILCLQRSTDPVSPFELASHRSGSEVAGMEMEVPEKNPAREKREMDSSYIERQYANIPVRVECVYSRNSIQTLADPAFHPQNRRRRLARKATKRLR